MGLVVNYEKAAFVFVINLSMQFLLELIQIKIIIAGDIFQDSKIVSK